MSVFLHGRVIWISSLFFILFMLPAFAGSSPAGKPEMKANPVDEFRHNLALIDKEYESVRYNLEWLNLKISRMKAMDHPVQSNLYRSVDYKKQKLKALEKMRHDYKACLAKAKAPAPPEMMDNTDISSGMEKKILSQVEGLSLSGSFELMTIHGMVTLKTRRPILFASGSAVVPKESEPFLKKVSSLVKDRKVWIVVDGFADKNPIRTAKFPSNFELGAIRAANVVHNLVGKGVSPSVFKVASTGRYRFPGALPMAEKKQLERYVNLTITFEMPDAET